MRTPSPTPSVGFCGYTPKRLRPVQSKNTSRRSCSLPVVHRKMPSGRRKTFLRRKREAGKMMADDEARVHQREQSRSRIRDVLRSRSPRVRAPLRQLNHDIIKRSRRAASRPLRTMREEGYSNQGNFSKTTLKPRTSTGTVKDNYLMPTQYGYD